jgi:hypothetical protein
MVTRARLDWLLALLLGLALTVTVLGLLALTPADTLAAPGIRPLTQTTLVVTSKADSGPGTLRWALSTAGVSDTITFDPAVFPPADSAIITLTSPLPEIITDGLTLDGSNAGVVLDGNQLTGSMDGLVIREASGVTIQGLQIINFPDHGIYLSRATDCLIGGDNRVGAGPLGQGNLISGNRGDGVHLDLSDYNAVSGNRIGTDRSGTTALGNGDYGVFIGYDSWTGNFSDHNVIGGNTPGEGNLISGNERAGVNLYHGANNNKVSGNFIGTDVSGTAPLGNGADGVYSYGGGANNVIGGDTVGERNLISGNAGNGVYIQHMTDGNRVSGNYIR